MNIYDIMSKRSKLNVINFDIDVLSARQKRKRIRGQHKSQADSHKLAFLYAVRDFLTDSFRHHRGINYDDYIFINTPELGLYNFKLYTPIQCSNNKEVSEFCESVLLDVFTKNELKEFVASQLYLTVDMCVKLGLLNE